MYRLHIRRGAQRAIAKLNRTDRDRVRKAIEQLSKDPRPHGCIKLTGREGWRIRIGTCRVIYDIDDAQAVVTVERVAQRGQAYRQH